MNDTIKRNTVLVCILTAILVISGAMSASAAEESPVEEKLQEVLDTFLGENEVAPGLSVYIECPGLGIEWSGAAGTIAKEDPAPMTVSNSFRIASNTKTYVAAALLRLVEMERLGLDDRLSLHIPDELNELLKSDGYDTDSITIAHLLSHTAGLGDHSDDPRFVERILSQPQYQWTAEEKLGYLVEWREPVGAPGEKFVYSDSGYIILGGIIERLTGKSLGVAVRELLDYEHLGLDATYWEYTEKAPASAGPRAHQYFGDVDVTFHNASFDLYGGGGIITDSRELAIFMRKLLRGDVFSSRSTLEAMMTGGTDTYRFGLMILDCDGHEAIGHQGFWNTFAYHVPALDLTIGGSILNHDATNGRELMCRLVREIAGLLEATNK